MAKKALVVKQKRTPKFQVRGLHAVHPLRAAAGRLPQVQPVPDLLPHDGAPRRTARHHQVQLVTTENEHTAGPGPGRETAVRKASRP